ncbi:hypothetical protein Lalb_Chr19g0136041 [Lupinus albus]|uniref:Uncharacterized protein n=1 Tax=Lupinus albus TaxID=3870 RepID=A0A6A4NYW2_LUPAL|nr:hypothetical protein Lalb_Chr19g0136041 [Lupinus albus]
MACIVGYIVGPPLYWHFMEGFATSSYCDPYLCDCSSKPSLSIPQGTSFSTSHYYQIFFHHLLNYPASCFFKNIIFS